MTTTMVVSKPVQQSKTLIFNLLAFAVMALPLIQDWAGTTTLALPIWVAEILAVLIPLVNLFLRFMTGRPVTMSTTPGTSLVKAPGNRGR